jgi:surface antigen
VSNENFRGRHRAPGRHNPLNELKLLARESAQPAMKGAAVVAATGGLVVSFANSASADTLSNTGTVSANVANIGTAPQAATEAAPAVVGPATTAAPVASSALATIGFSAQPQAAVAARKAPAKPIVIEDVQVKTERATAAAAAKAAAARKAAAAKASRDLTRRSLTSSTSATKSTTNTSTPSASSGTRSSHNWATPGQCTWGALAKWYQSEGYYPGGWTGNAMAWASGAASAGYTVTGTPRTRSILVMQPGVNGSSSVGHVAWVTGVSGNKVTIIEMNALAGPYNYNTRTLTDGPGMQYIYAP